MHTRTSNTKQVKRTHAQAHTHADLLRTPTPVPTTPPLRVNPTYIPKHPRAPSTPPVLKVTPPAPASTTTTTNGLLKVHGRSNSTTDLYIPPRLNTQNSHVSQRSDDGRHLGASTSYDDLSRDTSLEKACRNVSISNRSLLESVRSGRSAHTSRDNVNINVNVNVNVRRSHSVRSGSGGGNIARVERDREGDNTVAVSVERLPGARRDAPVYVIDDTERPSLLQRSKTFISNRTESMRQSFRRRSNSNTAKRADKEQKRISLVFAQNWDGQKQEEEKPPLPKRKSSFRNLRKRLFPK